MRPLLAALAALLLMAANLHAESLVAEPGGLWQGTMHGTTPKTLKGATVVDDAGLVQLLEGHPLLIDVGPADRKPASLSPSAIWLPVHRSIPGAVWLPGAGSGTSDAQFAEAFRSRIAALSGGSADRAIVVFCHPDCWGSWNAGKRLVGLGYAHVYWYPGGIEGWQMAHETQIVKPDSAWVPAQEKKTSP